MTGQVRFGDLQVGYVRVWGDCMEIASVDGDMGEIFPELWKLRSVVYAFSGVLGNTIGGFCWGLVSGFVVFGSCVVLYMKKPPLLCPGA